MATNPLFTDGSEPSNSNGGEFVLPKNPAPVQPLPTDVPDGPANPAVELIRQKVANLYVTEPNTQQELREVEAAKSRSKHQQFMYDLSTSGKSLAEIQTEWHNYYVSLPDNEKHQVWQEFYEANERSRLWQPSTPQPVAEVLQAAQAAEPPKAVVAPQVTPIIDKPRRFNGKDLRSVKDIKETLIHHATAGGKLQKKHHLQSLAFGIGTGLIVLVIFLFGFFNEVIIAPFIQPSRSASATPIIVDPSSVTVSSNPEIIIPKINVEIPVDYTQTTTNETQIENALESGIVHYPSTVKPGEHGNAAFFGHSSNNIFNKGKYKFAFVLLHQLVPGDTFYLTYNGKVYIYKVTSKTVVDPTEISVLNDIPDKPATATLITCDPPGTSLHRLVVVGEQISPDPTTNTSGSNTSATSVANSSELPGNGPTLLGRFFRWLF